MKDHLLTLSNLLLPRGEGYQGNAINTGGNISRLTGPRSEPMYLVVEVLVSFVGVAGARFALHGGTAISNSQDINAGHRTLAVSPSYGAAELTKGTKIVIPIAYDSRMALQFLQLYFGESTNATAGAIRAYIDTTPGEWTAYESPSQESNPDARIVGG